MYDPLQAKRKPSRLWLLLHLWAGLCLKASADASGVTKFLSHSSSHSQGDIESAQVAANMAGAITVLLMVVGYFLSSRLVSMICKSAFKESHKKLILFSLPIIYLAVAIVLAMGVGLFTGVAQS